MQIGGGNVRLEDAKFTGDKCLDIAVVVHLATASFAHKKPSLQKVTRRIVLDHTTRAVRPRSDLID